MKIAVVIQYFDGCPGWELARIHLEEAAAKLGVVITIEVQRIETLDGAKRVGFSGSPTILISGRDPFGIPGAAPGLACRLYATPDAGKRANHKAAYGRPGRPPP